VFDLVDTINPETITFKVKTTFTNNLEHLSPLITATVSCDNNYIITEVAGTVTTP